MDINNMITDKFKKIFIIISLVLITNAILVYVHISPFSIKYFFPGYYYEVLYSAPAWLDNDNIICIKKVDGFKDISPGWKHLSEKYYLCKMNKDGNTKSIIMTVPRGFEPQLLSSNQGMIAVGGPNIIREDKTGATLEYQIAVVPVSGQGFKVLKRGMYPNLSPDGKLIVFMGEVMQIMDITGNNTLQFGVTQWEEHPMWSRDGNNIAFERNFNGSNREIWVKDSNSTDIKKLNVEKNSRKLVDYLSNGKIALNDEFGKEGFIYDLATDKETKTSVLGRFSPAENYYVTRDSWGKMAIYTKEGQLAMSLESGKRPVKGIVKDSENIW